MRNDHPEFQSFDLRAEVESQAHDLEALAPTRLRLVVDGGKAGELRVRADRGFLKILLTNLIENAVEAMEHLDSGEIRVELQRHGRHAMLRVHNDGDAVPEKLRRDIFRSGFSTKSTRKKGRGYGLRFCRRIALAHHGTLNYDESDLRPGASFVLTLPLERERRARKDSRHE
jgi:signal transduction histidine kinase